MSRKTAAATADRIIAMRVILSFCLVLISAVVLGRSYLYPSPPPVDVQTVHPGRWANQPNGGLVAKPEDLDFGEVGASSQLLLRVRLTNPTTEAVTITKFEGMCFGNVWTSDLTILPGETGVASVEFDVTRGTPASDPNLKLHRRRIIPVIDGHPGRHPGWEIRGKSRQVFLIPDYGFSWTQLEFDPDQPATRRFSVNLLPGSSRLTAVSTQADVRIQSSDQNAPESYEICVTPHLEKLEQSSILVVVLSAESPAGLPANAFIKLYNVID